MAVADPGIARGSRTDGSGTSRPSESAIESTGIGLSIVQKSVETVGGYVSVESELGSGCRFSFDWPKRIGEAEAAWQGCVPKATDEPRRLAA